MKVKISQDDIGHIKSAFVVWVDNEYPSFEGSLFIKKERTEQFSVTYEPSQSDPRELTQKELSTILMMLSTTTWKEDKQKTLSIYLETSVRAIESIEAGNISRAIELLKTIE